MLSDSGLKCKFVSNLAALEVPNIKVRSLLAVAPSPLEYIKFSTEPTFIPSTPMFEEVFCTCIDPPEVVRASIKTAGDVVLIPKEPVIEVPVFVVSNFLLFA